jgi:hypothetical protein
MQAYPDARAWGAPRLPEKRKDLTFHGVLDDGVGGEWGPDVEQLVWRGVPALSEVAFLHRPSRTLVLTDAVHNLGDDKPGFTRAVFRMLGGRRGFTTTVVERIVTRDRAAARASVEKLLGWDFDRVIMAHGDVLEHGGREALRGAYAWLF